MGRCEFNWAFWGCLSWIAVNFPLHCWKVPLLFRMLNTKAPSPSLPSLQADLCVPRLNEGDQVVLINGRDISDHTHDQVVMFIKASCESHSGELILLVRPNGGWPRHFNWFIIYWSYSFYAYRHAHADIHLNVWISPMWFQCVYLIHKFNHIIYILHTHFCYSRGS